MLKKDRGNPELVWGLHPCSLLSPFGPAGPGGRSSWITLILSFSGVVQLDGRGENVRGVAYDHRQAAGVSHEDVRG